MRLNVTPFVESDIAEVVQFVTDYDKQDMMNGWGCTPEEGLRKSIELSEEVLTARFEGKVLFIMGITPLGHMFMVKTKEMEKAALPFCYWARQQLYRWMWRYGNTEVIVNEGYPKLTRYLRWLGFREKPMWNGFINFTLSAKDFDETWEVS